MKSIKILSLTLLVAVCASTQQASAAQPAPESTFVKVKNELTNPAILIGAPVTAIAVLLYCYNLDRELTQPTDVENVGFAKKIKSDAHHGLKAVASGY